MDGEVPRFSAAEWLRDGREGGDAVKMRNDRESGERLGGSLTLGTIFRFWAPLAATWLIMSIEGPTLTAIIARLPDQALNLAAYGVSFHIGLFIEAPVIMILSAATALVRDRDSFRKLRRFTYGLNGILTLLMVIVVLPPIFEPFATQVLALPPRVAELAHIGTILLIPWPAAIGFRRFYQGILIRKGLTRLVAWGTSMRLAGMVLGALLLWKGFDLPGIVIGAASLSIAVTAEAIAARFMAARAMRELDALEGSGRELTYGEITRFYLPLALTSVIGLGAPPMITLFLGRSVGAIESLAIWPVLTGFIFLFRGIGLAWQEAVITLVGDRLEELAPVRRFTLLLSGGTSLLLAVVAFTPLADLWFSSVAGLRPDLVEFTRIPLILMILLPATSALLSLQRGVLVKTGRTGPITLSTTIEVTLIILLLMLLIGLSGMVGAVAAAIAVMLGRLIANGYITVPFLQEVRRISDREATSLPDSP